MEVAGGVSGQGGPEEDPCPVESLVGAAQGGGGAHEHGPRQSSGGVSTPVERRVRVDFSGDRAGAVDVGGDDRFPAVVEVLGEFGADPLVAEWDVSGHDERRLGALGPQCADDLVHQPQHAAGALEARQRGPVGVELVEQFGVHGVAVADPSFVVRGLDVFGELSGIGAVVLDHVLGDAGDGAECLAVGGGEQATADDLERFVAVRGPPLVCDARDDPLEPGEGFSPVGAAHLLVVGHVFALVHLRRGGDGDEQQHSGYRLDDLGEGLGERELGVEGAAGQVFTSVQFARVGDPLVDEDHGGPVLFEERPETVAGVGAGPVRLGDVRVSLLARELPRQHAPEGVAFGSVGHEVGRAGLESVADQRHALDALGNGEVSQEVLDVLWVLRDGRARGEVPHGEHGVGLAAAECGLQVDDGARSGVAAQAAGGPDQQVSESFGEVGALEEGDGLPVFALGLVGGDGVEVGGELCGVELLGGHVGVGCEDFAPGGEVLASGFGESGGSTGCAVGFGGGLPQYFSAVFGDLVGLRDLSAGAEEPLDGVECAVGVVVGESPGHSVGPGVACVPQLGGEGFLGAGEVVRERIPTVFEPRGGLLGDESQRGLRVGGLIGTDGAPIFEVGVLQDVDPGGVSECGAEGLGEECVKPHAECGESPSDAVCVAQRHGGLLCRCGLEAQVGSES